jgi:CheY-like chemotaxis protein
MVSLRAKGLVVVAIPLLALLATVLFGVALAQDRGARAFLTKPLDVVELLELPDGIAADRGQAGRA